MYICIWFLAYPSSSVLTFLCVRPSHFNLFFMLWQPPTASTPTAAATAAYVRDVGVKMSLVCNGLCVLFALGVCKSFADTFLRH